MPTARGRATIVVFVFGDDANRPECSLTIQEPPMPPADRPPKTHPASIYGGELELHARK